MDAKAFFAEIKQENYQPIYLLHGEEEFAKDRAVEALMEGVPEAVRAFNVDLLDNPDSTQLINAALTMPMMSERRMIVVREPKALLSNESDAKKTIAFLPDIPSTTTIALVQRGKADARKALYKAIDKQGGIALFDFYSETEAARWAVQRAGAQGVQLASGDAATLVMMTGGDLSALADELDKLCDFAGKQGMITVEMMRQSVHMHVEYTVFTMLEHFLAGRISQGMVQLAAAIEEDGVGAAMQLSAFFASRFRAMLLAARRLAEGKSMPAVVKEIGGSPYAAKKSIQAAQRFAVGELEEALLLLSDADMAMKSGMPPETALSDALLRIFARSR